MAAPKARIVIVALHHEPLQLSGMSILMKELRLVGAMAYPDQEFRDVLSMLSDGRVDVTPMISARYPLSEFAAAFAKAKNPEHGAKILVVP